MNLEKEPIQNKEGYRAVHIRAGVLQVEMSSTNKEDSLETILDMSVHVLMMLNDKIKIPTHGAEDLDVC
jgi:hypothetical protein